MHCLYMGAILFCALDYFEIAGTEIDMSKVITASDMGIVSIIQGRW